MKDRIRKVMESQHMTQQEFADFIHISPASLSSVFTGRTRPTIAMVEAIKNSLPDISTDWLMFGQGDMYNTPDANGEDTKETKVSGAVSGNNVAGIEPVFDFGDTPAPLSSAQSTGNAVAPVASLQSGQRGAAGVLQGFGDSYKKEVKNIDIKPRAITEIRIFYSDQTWETFVPKK